ncbi:MAG: hypothetical protein AMJ53_11775 [Gammaproteobacteria bacterium SG8_11]|nr:MAG: hypothetical protein AMJ53_11775 [Gammaproteobacteria bacterium SG8_11]
MKKATLCPLKFQIQSFIGQFTDILVQSFIGDMVHIHLSGLVQHIAGSFPVYIGVENTAAFFDFQKILKITIKCCHHIFDNIAFDNHILVSPVTTWVLGIDAKIFIGNIQPSDNRHAVIGFTINDPHLFMISLVRIGSFICSFMGCHRHLIQPLEI